MIWTFCAWIPCSQLPRSFRRGDWRPRSAYLGCRADLISNLHFRRHSTGTRTERQVRLLPLLRDDALYGGDGSEGHSHADLIYCHATRNYRIHPHCLPIYYSHFHWSRCCCGCCDSCCCCCCSFRPLIYLQELKERLSVKCLKFHEAMLKKKRKSLQ